MSKVKPVVGVPKSKLLRRNRRTETRNKKAERSNTAKNDPKSSYYLQTEKLVGERKRVIVPETKKEIYHFEPVDVIVRDPITNKITYRYTKQNKILDGYKTIPEHTAYHRVGHRYEELKSPITRRSDFKSLKKYYRKLAARQLRRKLKFDEFDVGGYSKYKRDYDIAWEIY